MEGIQWDALPLLFEIYGVDDPETTVEELIVIREHFRMREDD